MAKAKAKRDEAREERITMEIVVDAYGPEEQAMGWYYYLQDTMQFPFTARCIYQQTTHFSAQRRCNCGSSRYGTGE